MSKLTRVKQRTVTAARLELNTNSYCHDCEQTRDQTPINFNDWFNAWLCPDCEQHRQEQADQTAHAYQLLRQLGHM